MAKRRENCLAKGRVKKVDWGHTLGGGSGKIFAGPQFYCDFWKIKPRW